MSWSFSVPVGKASGFAERAATALEANRTNIKKYNPDGEDQAEKAVVVATELIASGVVGGNDVYVGAYLSGHGNPKHSPSSGWADDMVGVSVYQVQEVALAFHHAKLE